MANYLLCRYKKLGGENARPPRQNDATDLQYTRILWKTEFYTFSKSVAFIAQLYLT